MVPDQEPRRLEIVGTIRFWQPLHRPEAEAVPRQTPAPEFQVDRVGAAQKIKPVALALRGKDMRAARVAMLVWLAGAVLERSAAMEMQAQAEMVALAERVSRQRLQGLP